MKFSHNTQYLYAVGRTRALEGRLLTHMQMNRLVSAGSCEEVVKILGEFGFTRKLSVLQETPERFEEVFVEETKNLYQELSMLVKTPVIIEIFQNRYDLINCKLISKTIKTSTEKSTDVNSIDGITYCGSVSPQVLFEAIVDRKETMLPCVLRNVVRAFFKREKEVVSGRKIDELLDVLYLEEVRNSTTKIASSFLDGIVKMLTDKYNLTVLFRGGFREEEQADIFSALLKGGFLDMDMLRKMSGWSFSEIVTFLEKTRYTKVAKQMIQRGHENFVDSMEDSMMQCLLYYVNTANYLIDGFEPVLAYLFKKEAELHNVRMIYAGKMHGLSNSVLEEEVLVAL